MSSDIPGKGPPPKGGSIVGGLGAAGHGVKPSVGGGLRDLPDAAVPHRRIEVAPTLVRRVVGSACYLIHIGTVSGDAFEGRVAGVLLDPDPVDRHRVDVNLWQPAIELRSVIDVRDVR